MAKSSKNSYVTKRAINAANCQASKMEHVIMGVCASVKIPELDYKQLWRGR